MKRVGAFHHFKYALPARNQTSLGPSHCKILRGKEESVNRAQSPPLHRAQYGSPWPFGVVLRHNGAI
jgi:hypothetical protein